MINQDGGFIGSLNIFPNLSGGMEGTIPAWAHIVFNTMFCATAATIVSGAMAERTQFKSYLIYSVFISLIVYPVEAGWVWGGGWFGFNPASSYGLSTVEQAFDVSNVFMTTNIAAVVSTVTTMSFTWIKYKKPDVSMTLNGSLAGLVAITAGCSVVDPWAAAVIGICSGILVVLGIEFVDKKLHIDDPVGAVGVHGVNGMFGALACGLFNRDTGLFTTGDPGQLAVQAIGVLAIVAWTAVLMTVCFLVIKKTIGLRVSKAEEIKGLDSTEHGLAMAYADFMPSAIPTVNMTSYKDDIKTEAVVEAPVEEAVPVEMVGTDPSSAKIYKVSIYFQRLKLM